MSNNYPTQSPSQVNGVPHTHKQLEQMRPTLVIGAGGTGQIILTYLKSILITRFGSAWQQRIRLLAFDTADEAFTLPEADGLLALEPMAEFFHIGNVPVPSIMRNLESQKVIQARLGMVMSKLPPVVLRSGAKQLRPFGLLSLLWNYTTVSEQIKQALWRLAGRRQMNAKTLTQQQGINVFICGSLVGGTGSGTLLDLAHLIRTYFTELGTQAEFCHITGVGILPQAFYGISGPNLLPNTGAFLRELNHLMVQGGFSVRYPNGRIVSSQEAPFDIFHAVDGVDAKGQTWSDIYEVTAMVAEGIYLQMGTQLGRKGENAFDNLDEVLSTQTEEGQGNFLGSLGKGDLLFDAPRVATVCAGWFLLECLQETWLLPSQSDVAESQANALLNDMTIDQTATQLKHDPHTNSEMRVELALPNWLRHKAAEEVPSAAVQYVTEYGQARVDETLLPQIIQQSKQMATKQVEKWQTWLQVTLFHPKTSIHTVHAALQICQTQLSQWLKTAENQHGEQQQQQATLTEAMLQLETAVSRTATSFPIGRSQRLAKALDDYFRTAQSWYLLQVAIQINRSQTVIWRQLINWVEAQKAAIAMMVERLSRSIPCIKEESAAQLQQLTTGSIATISLADADYVRLLYKRYKPAYADIQDGIGAPVNLYPLGTEALSSRLLQVLHPHFAPIAKMHIEQVIEERATEMSARARRQQLFQLATPSWNVNRARLPDGGANMVRLEVLGVPDATNTLFDGEPMLVSTYDPHRLTALVVVAGGPPSALQQYDLYQMAVEQTAGKRPLYILPDFLTTADQGHLIFALASIFGLVYSQGTFFYYQPADELQNPIRLGNGLSNAIHAFSEQELLVKEASERIEGQIAHLGLQEAIAILTDYYTTLPKGNTTLDELLRQSKRLVRDYTDGLRRIDAFNAGIHKTAVLTRS